MDVLCKYWYTCMHTYYTHKWASSIFHTKLGTNMIINQDSIHTQIQGQVHRVTVWFESTCSPATPLLPRRACQIKSVGSITQHPKISASFFFISDLDPGWDRPIKEMGYLQQGSLQLPKHIEHSFRLWITCTHARYTPSITSLQVLINEILCPSCNVWDTKHHANLTSLFTGTAQHRSQEVPTSRSGPIGLHPQPISNRHHSTWPVCWQCESDCWSIQCRAQITCWPA